MRRADEQPVAADALGSIEHDGNHRPRLTFDGLSPVLEHHSLLSRWVMSPTPRAGSNDHGWPSVLFRQPPSKPTMMSSSGVNSWGPSCPSGNRQVDPRPASSRWSSQQLTGVTS